MTKNEYEEKIPSFWQTATLWDSSAFLEGEVRSFCGHNNNANLSYIYICVSLYRSLHNRSTPLLICWPFASAILLPSRIVGGKEGIRLWFGDWSAAKRFDLSRPRHDLHTQFTCYGQCPHCWPYHSNDFLHRLVLPVLKGAAPKIRNECAIRKSSEKGGRNIFPVIMKTIKCQLSGSYWRRRLVATKSTNLINAKKYAQFHFIRVSSFQGCDTRLHSRDRSKCCKCKWRRLVCVGRENFFPYLHSSTAHSD